MASSKQILKDYFESLRSLTIKSNVVNNARNIKFYMDSRNSAVIRADEPLEFKDGARLKFFEVIRFDPESNIVRQKYSYEYQKADNSYYFRYERDADKGYDEHGNFRYDHAPNHLHANNSTPRYITHSTNFEEVFSFIIACFYDGKTLPTQ